MPGLAVELLVTGGFDPTSVLAVGATPLDRTAAARLGMRYLAASELASAHVAAPDSP